VPARQSLPPGGRALPSALDDVTVVSGARAGARSSGCLSLGSVDGSDVTALD
jgi:hypothetical protein